MEINELEKNKNLEKNIEQEKSQKNFLETTLGKTINLAVDIGLRAVLPDFIEEQVINLKDNLLENGLKEGIKKTIDDAIDLGKSTIGIVTGDFENINQMQDAIKNGGIIDGISSLLDTVVNQLSQNNIINYNVANTILKGKDIILNNVESNIEKTFNNQIESIEKTNSYINNWKEFYNNKDFEGMEKEYSKLENELTNLVPLENLLKEARIVENIHNLIKNNGQNFNLTQEQIELSNKL
mgnify:FL=1